MKIFRSHEVDLSSYIKESLAVDSDVAPLSRLFKNDFKFPDEAMVVKVHQPN